MDWLSLKISGRPLDVDKESKIDLVKILIPKKVVKLATRRNRLRRLIKEALRLQFLLRKENTYVFRVVNNPGEIGLCEVKEAISGLEIPCR